MIGNNGSYYIIDSTLREGQQNSVCNLSLEQKKEFLLLLDLFGIEYAELTNPNASQNAFDEFQSLINFKKERNLSIKLIAHIRNHQSDVEKVLQLQMVHGISLVISTSSVLIDASHKQTIDQIIEDAVNNLKYIKENDNSIEIRFSTEDSFRTDPNVLSKLFLAIEDYVDRIGIADTIGVATHFDIENTICLIKNSTSSSLDIECHFHNDSSSAVYNAYIALTNGCTHINTSVLGLGERNGITDLSGLISRLYTTYPESLKKYNLHILHQLDTFISKCINVPIPINNPITGQCSFHHKAGIHTNAMNSNRISYQIINPKDFNLSDSIIVFSSIMGYNSLDTFLKQNCPDIHQKLTTAYIKKLCSCIKIDISKNPKLYDLMNNNTDFAINYILKMVC
jgi:homocitrate synthase